MKQLLKREAEAQQSDSSTGSSVPWFADALLEQAGKVLPTWVGSNRGCFVVEALEAVPSTKAGVRKVMEAKAVRTKLVNDAKTGSSVAVKVRAFYTKLYKAPSNTIYLWFTCSIDDTQRNQARQYVH